MGRRRKQAKQGNPKRAVGYLRVSTEEQSLGIDAQRAALVAWCEREGVALVAIFTDLGVSGGAALDKRPALLDAINALTEHDAGVLLVQKRDRLAREIVQAAIAEQMAEKKGARILTTEGDNGDGPDAVLMKIIKDGFAQYERLIIQARTRAALAVKKSRGERVGSVPYGQLLSPDGRSLIGDGTGILEAALGLRQNGLTLAGIGVELVRQGFAPRSNRQAFHPQTVSNILRQAETEVTA